MKIKALFWTITFYSFLYILYAIDLEKHKNKTVIPV